MPDAVVTKVAYGYRYVGGYRGGTAAALALYVLLGLVSIYQAF